MFWYIYGRFENMNEVDYWLTTVNLPAPKYTKRMVKMATILVDQDLCTRCGICAAVCPVSIVDPADENSLPKVQDTNAGMCIRCGHCEVSCPSQALLLNYLPDEKVALPAGGGSLSPDDLGMYLDRKSTRLNSSHSR